MKLDNQLQQQYEQRRKRLMRAIGKRSAVVLSAATIAIRNRDADFPFRQDSDFHYLTGFQETDAILVLRPGREQGEFVMFCQDRDPSMELWNGKRAGQAGAKRHYGADQAWSISAVDEKLPKLLEGVERLYCNLGQNEAFDKRLLNWVKKVKTRSRAGVRAPVEYVDLSEVLHEMRLVKSSVELGLMRTAADISAQAHVRAMQYCQPGMMEYQVQAEVEYVFSQHGCVPAYGSIVGGGENACVLHYVQNNARLKNGDLLLIDAGAEHQCYAADITRTFPVNGEYSEAQQEIYEIVLEAQLAAIKKVKPGNPWNAPHDAAVRVISRGLKEVGLLRGDLKNIIKKESYRKFFMHGTGHWLGMDVHDVGDYKIDGKWRPFKAGMVLTVEPGIYIAPKTKGVAKRWWNIGIRIEDDVHVTRTGHEVLTAGVPKTVKEIENLVGSAA